MQRERTEDTDTDGRGLASSSGRGDDEFDLCYPAHRDGSRHLCVSCCQVHSTSTRPSLKHSRPDPLPQTSLVLPVPCPRARSLRRSCRSRFAGSFVVYAVYAWGVESRDGFGVDDESRRLVRGQQVGYAHEQHEC